MQNKLEKFGSIGTIIAAAACPICFPKLALIGAMFGMGALAQYETLFFFAAQILFLLALAGHVVSYRTHQNKFIIAMASISTILLFTSLYVFVSEILSYIAFLGLAIASIHLILINRHRNTCSSTTDNG